MPSTLYRPESHRHLAAVVDLDAARVRLRGQPDNRTLLLRCATMRADEEILRHIGVSADSTLDDLRRVLEIAFAVPSVDSPSRFTLLIDAPSRLPSATHLSEYLRAPGDAIYFHWGLWRFTLDLLDIYPRDAATPDALCVAGAGDFGEVSFDMSAINAQLIGSDAIDSVLASARAEVVDVVERSESMDFVPLLQALDLTRETDLAPDTPETLASLPRERDPRARDAFWATVLALSCLADEHTTDAVVEATMEALGHGASAAEAREACAGSLVRLASVGGYGAGAGSAVDKLEIYRALLRR